MIIKKIKRGLCNPKNLLVLLLNKTARLWPDKIYLKILFYLEKEECLNLDVPKTFCEKIQWLKLYNQRSIYTMMVDKLAVKEYVAEKIGSQYIIPTISVWNRIEDIDWDALPNQFVLKTTHGGGSCGVVICKDKNNLNIFEASRKLRISLNSDIYIKYREWPYKNVPKRIIVEKFMSESNIDDNDKDLADFKFYCFNGIPYYCQVIRGRRSNETIDFYDMQWNHMPFIGLNPNVRNGQIPVEKPIHLNKMIDICKTLSAGIPFARIDLYLINHSIYFGEITFFPASGLGRFTPYNWDYKLGEMINLPPVKYVAE